MNNENIIGTTAIESSVNGESQVINLASVKKLINQKNEVNVEDFEKVINNIEWVCSEKDIKFMKKTLNCVVLKTFGLTAFVNLTEVIPANGDDIKLDKLTYRILVLANTGESFGFTYTVFPICEFFSRKVLSDIIFTMAYKIVQLEKWSDIVVDMGDYYTKILPCTNDFKHGVDFESCGNVIFWAKLESEEAA